MQKTKRQKQQLKVINQLPGAIELAEILIQLSFNLVKMR